ncbi:hypothetical protein PC118_g22914 [Phytophthora cactorum]|uniref:Uncharacterized protein n=1 Tax=Phytophthora cactorum TaxID=29920 RepID=A0A8T1ES23_9STRA|nr:hypothetical protein PC118_g22914 [Phytophthora cactorum]
MSHPTLLSMCMGRCPVERLRDFHPWVEMYTRWYGSSSSGTSGNWATDFPV